MVYYIPWEQTEYQVKSWPIHGEAGQTVDGAHFGGKYGGLEQIGGKQCRSSWIMDRMPFYICNRAVFKFTKLEFNFLMWSKLVALCSHEGQFWSGILFLNLPNLNLISKCEVNCLVTLCSHEGQFWSGILFASSFHGLVGIVNNLKVQYTIILKDTLTAKEDIWWKLTVQHSEIPRNNNSITSCVTLQEFQPRDCRKCHQWDICISNESHRPWLGDKCSH